MAQNLGALKRMNTEDYILQRQEEMGEDSQAYHDLPKIMKPGSEAKEGFSKVLQSNNEMFHQYQYPPKVSDWKFCGSFPSPLTTNPSRANLGKTFVSNNETVLVDIIGHASVGTISREFLRAGPREYVSYHPDHVKAAIVTCGGLCPGLNSVVREIFTSLTSLYGVKEVYGVPMGFRGFYATEFSIKKLDYEYIDTIHHEGGSVLGSSRGGHDTKLIVDAIQDFGFNHIYIIGGDGTHRGAMKIFDELRERELKVTICGIPKTIDNDIALIDKSFGFDTAVEEAQRAIRSGKVEARSTVNGIGLIKLMGRHSGMIAMYSCLASRDVNACLIPEVPFELNGSNGLFQYIQDCFDRRGHCVIVVAEGAGMDLLQEELAKAGTDASGNVKYPDIGLWLKSKINEHFAANKREINLKYIDPTYMIRTVPPNANDQIMCSLLGQSAVHGAMAGFSGFTVGLVNTHYVMIPMEDIANRGRSKVDPHSRMWHRVAATTGQPNFQNPK
ncbi:ATP-dependent 6-phosphofructokinase 7 [Porphyridium purpureum]|uniref:ATP-dependent 6-phosphofructokinase 7 n=1 Tax=Porphyridium purpureum TaxID=35688 RepID=A0A5J4YQ27_PORPP|nr:ATP-dependent 6-phosphofructokinase 7 [Porphyridium purpureum]|eukprot:POR2915..scf295_9